jgi:hypothetical protein
MAAPTEIRQRAITLLEQLPGESLVKAVKFLEGLSHETLLASAITPEASETALLEVIQRGVQICIHQRMRKVVSRIYVSSLLLTT